MRCEVALPEDYEWFVRKTGLPPTAWFRALKAVDESGRIRGMVGYDGWTPKSVYMHVAMETPAAIRCLLRPAFESLFVDADYEVALAITSMGKAKRLARKLGFRQVYVIKDGWSPGRDTVLFEMRKAECRWLSRERKAA